MALKEVLSDVRGAKKEHVMRGLERALEKRKDVRPAFSHTWVRPFVPDDSELIENYRVDGTEVHLYHLQEEMEDLYKISPPEYDLVPKKAELVSKVKESLAENQKDAEDLSDPNLVKDYIDGRGKKLVKKLAKTFDIELGEKRQEELKEVKRLSNMLTKYTAGYGVLETLLRDPRVEDIYVDAPAEQNKVYVEINGPEGMRDKCMTNIFLSSKDMKSMLSRFRFESGEPFSEAFPVLETDLSEYETRITAIGSPLSSDGVALALRKRDPEPWTLPKLINVGSLTPLAAGLLSFLIDGRSTIMIAGSRGAGKTTLLGALMLEFPQSQRILTIEDTRELPSREMQSLDYNVQSMMIGSGEYKGGLDSNEVLRVSLRLGESAIVMGEVRGEEAKTLYEAMRAGTAGSAVMGTIHGNTAQSVYDRVVHDMDISKESFAATDIVAVAGIVRPGGMQKQERRVTQIAEYHDSEFSDLMEFEQGLQPTEFFKRESKKIGEIARSWGLDYSEAVENIKLRAELKKKMVDVSKKRDDEILLGPEWVARTNNKFNNLVSKYGLEKDYDRIRKEWMDWFEERIRYV